MFQLELKLNNFHIETTSAIFIIALVSFFILANLATGFILPLFLIIMSVAFLIAIFYPRSGLYSIIFLTFIFERFFTLQPIILGRAEYKLYPLDIIFLGVMGGIIWSLINKVALQNNRFILRNSSASSQNDRLFQKKDYFLMAFIVLVGAYFFFSTFVLKSDFALAFSSFKNYAFYSLFYFAVLFLINNKEHLIRLIKFALAGTIGIIFFIAYGILNGGGLWSEFAPLSTEGVRALAFTHAFYLSMAVIFSVTWLSFKKDNFSKYFPYLAIIWSVGILGSMMRHLWIGLFISLLFLYFILPKKNKLVFKRALNKYFLIMLMLFIFVFYLMALFPHSELNKSSAEVFGVVKNRITSTTDIYDESILWRNAVWHSTLGEYIKNPILGLGFGKKVFIEIGSYKDLVEIRNIHNSFIALLVQMGILGAGIFIFFIGKIIRNALKEVCAGNDSNIFRLATLSVLVFYLIVFMFQPYLETNLLGIFFWINLGILRISANLK